MNKAYVTEAAGLRPGNNRWRALWRCAGPELRAAVHRIMARELNKLFAQVYKEKLPFPYTPSQLFRDVPIWQDIKRDRGDGLRQRIVL